MLDWFYPILVGGATLAGLLLVLLGLFGKAPSGFSLAVISITEFLLLMQLVASVTVVTLGQRAQTSTLEFFGYLITAIFVPPAAAAWAILERSKWSTVVLGVGSLTVAVMVVRMQQLWTGVLPL
jgi:hypothetical protein